MVFRPGLQLFDHLFELLVHILFAPWRYPHPVLAWPAALQPNVYDGALE